MKKVLIFLEPFRVENQKLDEQNFYLIPLSIEEAVMSEIGSFIEVNTLKESDYQVS